jgi:hypothetical protein
MTTNRNQRLADLQSALDAFGADRTRWPAHVRHGLSAFVSGDAEAQRLVNEAAAFDRLLDAAPTLSADRLDALAHRISALAERQPHVIHSREKMGVENNAPHGGLGFARRERAFAGAALAASLLLGIFAGQTPAIDPGAALLIETTASDDGAAQQFALSDDADVLLYEDLL